MMQQSTGTPSPSFFYTQPQQQQQQQAYSLMPPQQGEGGMYAFHPTAVTASPPQPQPAPSQQQVFWIAPQQQPPPMYSASAYTQVVPSTQQPQQYYVFSNGMLHPMPPPTLPHQTTPPGSMQAMHMGNAQPQHIQAAHPQMSFPGASAGTYVVGGAGSGSPSLQMNASAGQVFASSIHSSLSGASQSAAVRSSMHLHTGGYSRGGSAHGPNTSSMGSSIHLPKHSSAGSTGVGSFKGRGAPSGSLSQQHQAASIGAVGPRPLSHAAEQPVPGVIHSVRPFLGPKGIGSILDTPSKLPLLDTLPPLARKRPRPVLIPQRELVV